MNFDLVINRISRTLIFIGPLVTLVISPIISYDPINSIKNLFVTSFAFSILGLLFRIRKEAFRKIGRFALLSVALFVISMVFVMLMSETQLTEQFYGVFGRNNGFLSYFSLALIFMGTLAVQNKETYRLILRSLQVTAIPMTIYCVIQILGYDPFAWSAFATFGTLGNVNFLSAFMGLAVLSTLYFLRETKSRISRVGLGILATTDIGIIWQTDSIQGLMMVLAGCALLLLFWAIKKSKFIAIPVFLLLSCLTYLVLQSFVNKGPLASLIYQPSITYRGDYMAAGWNIFLKHPLSGVGLDSYGDWYRAERGIVSTFRTGYGRTTNVSHNVYLDMAANGGILLFGSFLLLSLLVFFVGIKALRKTKFEDLLLIALFVIWIVFQFQAMISIAQIGISIWGWLISGSLLGYSKILLKTEDKDNSIKKVAKRPKKVTLDAASSIFAFVGFALGFTLAFLHFKVDVDYRSYSQKQDLTGMVEVTKNPVATSFFYVNTQYLALRSNYPEVAYEVNSRLRSKFPREIAGWFGLLNMPSATAQEKDLAKLSIKRLDPYFYCLEPNPALLMREKLLALPQAQQRELAFAWGADPMVYNQASFNLSMLGEGFLSQRFNDFCS